MSNRLFPGLNKSKKIKRKVGTKATLNGKPVIWDGRKWVPAPKHSQKVSGSKIPSTSKKRGLSNIPPKEGPLNNPNFGKPGNPSTKAPKPTEYKPTESKQTKSKPTESKPTKEQLKVKPKPRGKRDYGSKEKNLAAWAKANPKLAKRLEDKKKAKAKRLAGGTLYSGRTGMSNIS